MMSDEQTEHDVEVQSDDVSLTRLQALSLRSYDFIDSLARRILHTLQTRPTSSRLFIGSIVALMFLFSLGHTAHAQQQRSPHMLQDEIDQAYKISTQFGIFSNAIAFAQYLFATLAALTVIVNVLAYYIRNQSVKGVGQVVLSSILRLGIPFVIIALAPTVLPAISLVGLQVANVMTGNNGANYSNGSYTDAPPPPIIQTVLSDLYNTTFGTLNNGSSSVTVTPSSIAQFGENIGFTIIDKATCAAAGGTEQASGCVGSNNQPTGQTYQSNNQVLDKIIILAIAIIGTFVFIAVELIIAYLQIYLVLPVAAFSLGFLGSPATRQYGAGYWNVVVSALLKFVTVVFTIGFAVNLAQIWSGDLANIPFNAPSSSAANGGDVNALKTAISYSMVSFSLLFIVRILPSLFQGLLSGNAGSGEGNQAEYQTQNAARGGGGRGGSGAGLGTGGRTGGYFGPGGGGGVGTARPGRVNTP